MLAVVTWPILERIPLFADVAISPHGIGTAAGFVLGGWMMTRAARRADLGDVVGDVGEAIASLLTWVGVGAILGARGFWVVNHLDRYVADPLSALAVWEGGLTLLGGITGGTVVGVVLARRWGWGPDRLLDAAAPGLAAGIAVGRLGDLAIGDHIGAPAPDFPLAWRCSGNLWERATNSFGFVAPQPYPEAATPVQGCFDVPVVQTAMVDVLAASLTLLVVLAVRRTWRNRPLGALAAVFVASYGTGRLVLDMYRQDVRHLGLTASQWTALFAVVATLAWLARVRLQHAQGRAEEGAGKDGGPGAGA